MKAKDVQSAQIQLRVGDSCPAGAAIRVINVKGGVLCEADDMGGGGAPSGPAGGSLAGTYPNPTLTPNSVATSQIADDALNSSKVADGSLLGSDINDGSLTGNDVLNRSLTNVDVANNGLGGGEIDEATLGQVPSALLGGVGRSNSDQSCDPNTTTFVTCLHRAQPACTEPRTRHRDGPHRTADEGFGTCALASTVTGTLPGTVRPVSAEDEGGPIFGTSEPGLVAVSAVQPAGANTFALDCNESIGDISYGFGQISAVALTPN